MSGIERLYSPPGIGAPGRRDGLRLRRELWLAGLLITVMALVLAIAVVVATGHFERRYRLNTSFLIADGIEQGTMVKQDGYSIGKVSMIEPRFTVNHPTPRFELQLSIDDDWHISKDSVAKIVSGGLLKGNIIIIVPGESSQRLAEGDSITGIENSEQDIIETVTTLLNSVQAMVNDKIDPLMASINRQVRAIEGLSDGENSDTVKQPIAATINNLQQITNQLNQTVAAINAKEVEAMVLAARSSVDDIKSFTTNLKQQNQQINQIIKSQAALARRLDQLVKKSDPLITRTLSDTQQTMDTLSTSIKPLLDNLNQAARNLNTLSQDLKNNPVVRWGHDRQRDNRVKP